MPAPHGPSNPNPAGKPEPQLSIGGPGPRGSGYWAAWFYCAFKGYAKNRSLTPDSPGGALALGQAVHQAEAQHYLRLRERQQGRDPEAWMEPIQAVKVAQARGIIAPLDREQQAKIEPIYLSGHNPNQVKGPEPILVEEVMTVELGDLDCPGHPEHGMPITYAPRVDLVLQDGKWIDVDDHKTAARPSRTTIEAYSNHFQFIMLAVLGRLYYGDAFRTVKLHLIETDGSFRHEWIDLGITEFQQRAMIQNFYDVAHYKAKLELEVLKGQRDPLMLPRATNEEVCQGRYSKCRMFDICRRGSVGSKGITIRRPGKK